MPGVFNFSRRTYSAWVYMTLALICMGLYIVGASLWRFDGYTVHGYTAIPAQACGGTPIQLDVDRELVKPPGGRFGDYRLETYWESLDGLQRTPVEIFPGTLRGLPYGRSTRTSPALRTTPIEAGVWRLVSVVRYDYTIFGWPRSDGYTSFRSEQILTTLAAEDPECLTFTTP